MALNPGSFRFAQRYILPAHPNHVDPDVLIVSSPKHVGEEFRAIFTDPVTSTYLFEPTLNIVCAFDSRLFFYSPPCLWEIVLYSIAKVNP